MAQTAQPQTFVESNGALELRVEFSDFITAFSFLTQVALLAEQANHHPEIENVYGRVRLRLCTHDAGGSITELDRTLAAAIEKRLASFKI